MPIYEYRCDSCESVFEEMRRHADDIMEQPCPACGKEARRLISNTTFVLKGGGWYVTEYGNKKTESTSGAAGESASETKSEPAAAQSAPDAAASAASIPAAPAAASAAAMAS